MMIYLGSPSHFLLFYCVSNHNLSSYYEQVTILDGSKDKRSRDRPYHKWIYQPVRYKRDSQMNCKIWYKQNRSLRRSSRPKQNNCHQKIFVMLMLQTISYCSSSEDRDVTPDGDGWAEKRMGIFIWLKGRTGFRQVEKRARQSRGPGKSNTQVQRCEKTERKPLDWVGVFRRRETGHGALLETVSQCEIFNFQVSTMDCWNISNHVNYMINGMIWSFRENIWM